jgi:hypothetical protein
MAMTTMIAPASPQSPSHLQLVSPLQLRSSPWHLPLLPQQQQQHPPSFWVGAGDWYHHQGPQSQAPLSAVNTTCVHTARAHKGHLQVSIDATILLEDRGGTCGAGITVDGYRG